MSDIVLDVTGGSESTQDGVMIDASGDSNAVNRVDLSSLNRGNSHRHISPKDKEENKVVNNNSKRVVMNKPKMPQTQQPVVTAGKKKVVNISELGLPSGEESVEVHESYEKDILNIDDPDSPFAKYVKDKEAEAVEWIAQKEEEKALKESMDEEEAEIEEYDGSNDNEIVIGNVEDDDEESINMTSEQGNYEIDELDISSLDKEEEPVDMADEIKTTVDDEAMDIDSEIDTEDLPDASEIDEEDAFEDEEEDEDWGDQEDEAADEEEEAEEVPAVEQKAEEELKPVPKKPEKPKQFDAPDIDIDEELVDVDDIANAAVEEDEDESGNVGDTDNDEVLKNLQKLAMEKLKPVSTRLDISSFTVLKKPVANVNPIFKDTNSRVIKWVLPAQESIVLMKSFNGSEIEKLREYSENSGSLDYLNRRFKLIYDHIVSPKPDSFDVWLKTTPFDDLDHYFFAIYIACFKGANFIPGDCINTNCKATFISDDINIMDMVKFNTEEAKAKFTELYKSEATPAGKGIYCSEIVPISEKIAISFRQPSFYNIFETTILTERDTARFASVIPFMPYIDTIYMIDQANRSLVPITYKMYPDNQTKTLRSKIMKYDKVFSSLTVDQFGPIRAYIDAIVKKTSDMKYVLPALECPKCHTMTEEHEVSPEDLVFTRYQLGWLVTTSLN